jgi:hypothetical protein
LVVADPSQPLAAFHKSGGNILGLNHNSDAGQVLASPARQACINP